MPPATIRRNPAKTVDGQPRGIFGHPTTFVRTDPETGEQIECLSVKEAAKLLGISHHSFGYHSHKHPEFFGADPDEWLYAYDGQQRVFRVKDLLRFKAEYLSPRTGREIKAAKAARAADARRRK